MAGFTSDGRADLSFCCKAVYCLEFWCRWRMVLLLPMSSLQSSPFARVAPGCCCTIAGSWSVQFVDFSLGNVGHLFMVLDGDLVW